MFKKRVKATHLETLDELGELTADGKPVLIDFFQVDCRPCRIMSGIVDELAEEFAGSAHVVKVDVRRVPGAVAAFAIRSTPTFVLLGRSQRTPSKKARKRAGGAPAAQPAAVSPRWRASGLVKKDDLAKVLETNGASRAG
jgi:thioredoxin 1